MAKQPVSWQTYEEVARFLLDDIADYFGVARFEGKQKTRGYESGTDWEIDAKGVSASGDIVLIVECRRHTKRKSPQEHLAARAYRIRDTGARGGIIVTPLGIQTGAELVARAANIHTVKLDPSSTAGNYIIEFMNQIRIGFTDHIPPIHDALSITKMDKNGNVIERLDV